MHRRAPILISIRLSSATDPEPHFTVVTRLSEEFSMCTLANDARADRGKASLATPNAQQAAADLVAPRDLGDVCLRIGAF